jgi:hypothetical protein
MKIVVRQLVKYDDAGYSTEEEGMRISFDDKIVFETWEKDWFMKNEPAEVILEMLGHVFTWESEYPEEKESEYPDYLHGIDGNPYDIDDFPGHRD